MGRAEGPSSQSIGGPAGFSGQPGYQEQPERPAWLESLQVSDQPMGPQSAPPSFQAADLIDEGALPGWMRPQHADDEMISNPHLAALRPSSMSAPNTDEGTLPPRNIAARSLIDEQAIPQWMQNNQQASVPQRNIDASSLIQHESLPSWLQGMQPQAGPTRPTAPAQPPTAQAQQRPGPQPMEPNSPARGFSAKDLIDQSSLPPWLADSGGQGQAAGAPVNSGRPAAPGQGFSAASLVDQNALPSWLKSAEQGSQQHPGQPAQAGVPPQGQRPWQEPQSGGFSQAPYPPQGQRPWQEPQSGGVSQAPYPMPPAQPNQAWQGQQSFAQGPSANYPAVNVPPSGGTFSAGSLIDQNALPQWMREGNNPQAGSAGGPTPMQDRAASGYQSVPRPVPYNMGARESAHIAVPNRPRGEFETNQGSEAAANAFASMLGVASAAPQFPTPQGALGAQGPTMSPASPQSAYSSQQMQSGVQPPQMQPPQGYPASAPYGYPGGYPGGPQGSQQPMMGVGPGGMAQPGTNIAGAGAPPAAGSGAPHGAQPAAKPPKRNLFEFFRSWFSRQ